MKQKQNEKIGEDMNWKNHNPFYYNLYDFIDKITKCGYFCSIETNKYILDYYSLIKSFIITHRPYLENYKDFNTKLEELELKLYSKLHLSNINDKKVFLFQRKVFNKLQNLYSESLQNLYNKGVLPKSFDIYNKKVNGAFMLEQMI